MRDFNTNEMLERDERELFEMLERSGAGKKMPYAPPAEDFFEKFTQETLATIDKRRVHRRLLNRITVAFATAAAMIAVALVINLPSEGSSTDLLAKYDVSLDQYVESLSDDELNALLYDMESGSEFYANL